MPSRLAEASLAPSAPPRPSRPSTRPRDDRKNKRVCITSCTHYCFLRFRVRRPPASFSATFSRASAQNSQMNSSPSPGTAGRSGVTPRGTGACSLGLEVGDQGAALAEAELAGVPHAVAVRGEERLQGRRRAVVEVRRGQRDLPQARATASSWASCAPPRRRAGSRSRTSPPCTRLGARPGSTGASRPPRGIDRRGAFSGKRSSSSTVSRKRYFASNALGRAGAGRELSGVIRRLCETRKSEGPSRGGERVRVWRG